MPPVHRSFSARRTLRSVILAEAFAACLASSSAFATVVDSPISNVDVPATTSGVYINLVTGATGTAGSGTSGWDLNPYLTGSGFGIYWPPGPTDTSGGLSDGAATPMLLLLTPGSTITSSGPFTRAIQAAASFRGSQTAYLGFRFFNEGTAAINYGYCELTNTAGNGFPATVVHCAYEDSGGPITIPDNDTIFFDGFDPLPVN